MNHRREVRPRGETLIAVGGNGAINQIDFHFQHVEVEKGNASSKTKLAVRSIIEAFMRKALRVYDDFQLIEAAPMTFGCWTH
jgi:hypothetical protein